ncbi:hypothetical protein BDK51DRAFT_52232 [Blyttiomyces helicus]|uniref:Uncharacterized protein n=1 Tax=Blyttiomyces helicus TaxID=388810 RepID=A0A4P9WMN2_9FUNG|nr:hypothetical protein BDK51DRAFT_52232 [Blyttiomyces helicus]|eukprot:RKO94174.1 hypothetical protein BDK51DRAFT_52232 [Blyttiomyces helicus]
MDHYQLLTPAFMYDAWLAIQNDILNSTSAPTSPAAPPASDSPAPTAPAARASPPAAATAAVTLRWLPPVFVVGMKGERLVKKAIKLSGAPIRRCYINDMSLVDEIQRHGLEHGLGHGHGPGHGPLLFPQTLILTPTDIQVLVNVSTFSPCRTPSLRLGLFSYSYVTFPQTPNPTLINMQLFFLKRSFQLSSHIKSMYSNTNSDTYSDSYLDKYSDTHSYSYLYLDYDLDSYSASYWYSDSDTFPYTDLD